MMRTFNSSNRSSVSDNPENSTAKPVLLSRSNSGGVGGFWDMVAIRLIFTVVCVAAG